MPKGFLLKEGVLFPTYSTWSIVYIKKKRLCTREASSFTTVVNTEEVQCFGERLWHQTQSRRISFHLGMLEHCSCTERNPVENPIRKEVVQSDRMLKTREYHSGYRGESAQSTELFKNGGTCPVRLAFLLALKHPVGTSFARITPRHERVKYWWVDAFQSLVQNLMGASCSLFRIHHEDPHMAPSRRHTNERTQLTPIK